MIIPWKTGKTGWYIGGSVAALLMILLAESLAPPRSEIKTPYTNNTQKDYRPTLKNIKTISKHLLDEKAEHQTLIVARLSGVPEPANGPMAILSQMEEVRIPYLDQLDMSAVKVPATWDADWLIEIIQQDPSVDYAYKQSKAELFGVIPDDSDFGDQTNLHDPDNDVDVDAPEAWAYTTGSENVVVAVLDQGFYINNPDLRPNLWVNEAELEGEEGMDDDNNGCIDDIHGCNFRTSSGKNLVGTEPEHGTEVSSILASRGNDGYGIAGAAWNIRIMPLLSIGNRIQAYQYILKMKRQFRVNIRVMNYSAGEIQGCDPQLLRAKHLRNTEYVNENRWLSELKDEEILFVQAAGNNGIDYNSTSQITKQLEPGCHKIDSSDNLDNIIVVAGQGKTSRERWEGSNYGSVIADLYAPAEEIPTSPRQVFLSPLGHRNILDPSGTSLAAPHVAGAAALLWSYKPDLTIAEVHSALLDTVDRFPAFVLSNTVASSAQTLAEFMAAGFPAFVVTNTVASGGALNIANALYSVATPGIRIHSSQTTIAEGTSGYIDLSLTREPVRPSSGEVVVLEGVATPLSDADAVVTPSTLTFTSRNWHIPQRMTVRAAGTSGSEIRLTVEVDRHLSTTHYQSVPMRTATMTLQSEGIRPTLHIPARIAEGDTATATIRFSDPLINAAQFTITATGTATKGTDYTLLDTITATTDSNSVTFTIPTITDNTYEPDEIIHLQITTENSRISPQTLQATLTIEDSDTPIMTISVFPRAITQSNTETNAPTATATIQLDRPAIADVPFSLDIRAGYRHDISHLRNHLTGPVWPASATITENATSTEIIIHSIDEDDEPEIYHRITLTLNLPANAAARLGTPHRARLNVWDDDGNLGLYLRLRVFMEGAMITDTTTIQTDP